MKYFKIESKVLENLYLRGYEMIKLFSPPGITHSLQSSPFLSGKRVLGNDLLKQKIESLRQQRDEWNKKINKAQGDQIAMRHLAVVIDLDQKEIEREQKTLKNQQDQENQNIHQIQQEQSQMRRCIRMLSQTWHSLFNQALQLQASQQQVQIKFNRVEKKRQLIQQHAFSIHQNFSIMRQNLQEANLQACKIELKAKSIQENHLAIQSNIMEIEERQEHIRLNIPRLFTSRQSHMGPQMSKENNLKKKRKNSKNPFSESWLKKIQNFCLSLLAWIFRKIAQIEESLKKKMVFTSFSILHSHWFFSFYQLEREILRVLGKV